MIEIKKSQEPSELLRHRKSSHASYDNMSPETRKAVLESLMKEQGYLCAYCMCRIPQQQGEPQVTIEHWEAQSETDRKKAMDYQNMLAVCSGNRGCGSKNNMHCDAKRGNSPLTVNPLNPETVAKIKYKLNGRIFSQDEAINHDLDVTLNLNSAAARLVDNRRRALQTLQAELKKSRNFQAQCAKYYDKFCNQPKKTPYVGILLWWLERKLNHF